MIAKTVKMLREVFDYSVDDLADKIGHTSEYVDAMERGDIKLSFDILNRLSTIYGLSLRKIIELDEVNDEIDLSLEQIKFIILDYIDNGTERFLDSILRIDDFDKYRGIHVAKFTKRPFKLYTSDGAIEGNVTSCDFINLSNYSDSELSKRIEDDEKNYKGSLSFNGYLYLCLSKFDNNFGLDDKMVDRIKTIKQNYMNRVNYVRMIDQIMCDNQYYRFPDFEINEELVKFLNEGIDPNYTSDERILYYYFKMCSLFENDDRYLFALFISKTLNRNNFRKSPNRLSSLSPSNNHINCFEFEAILNKLIQKEGQITKIVPFSGSSVHAYTEAVINRRYYVFDSFASPVDATAISDLTNVKMGNLYTGVIANEEDILSGETTYYPYINKVYNDVCSELFFNKKKFSPWEIESCFLAIDCLKVSDSLKSRLRSYFNRLNDYPLSSGLFCLTLIRDRSFDFRDIIKMTCVCSTINDYRLGFVLSVCQKDDQFMYFYFGEDDTIKVFNEEKMTELISDNKIIVSKTMRDSGTIYRIIPGIDPKLQKDMNDVAEKTILPRLFNDIYEESLRGDKFDSSGIQKKKYDNL